MLKACLRFNLLLEYWDKSYKSYVNNEKSKYEKTQAVKLGFLTSAPSGIRTLDTLIKSQLL